MPSFTLELPFLPLSVNGAFSANFKTKRRFKSKDYEEFQRKVFSVIKRLETPNFDPLDHLSVEIDIYRDWYTQQKSIRKVDLANFEKTLIDTVFPHLQLDDAQIFRIKMAKIQTEGIEKTVLKIFSLTES